MKTIARNLIFLFSLFAAQVCADPIVIDVRTPQEWNTGYVEDAHLIQWREIHDKINGVTTDKNAEIIVYCAAGVRAERAKRILEGMGYTKVVNGVSPQITEDYLNSLK